MRMDYIVKSGDLVYRKHLAARPYFVYLILSILNKIPLHRMPFWFSTALAIIFRTVGLKATFTILNRTLRFSIHSNIHDFRYHGGMAHEPRVSELLLRVAPKNSVLYDIGCAVGWYSILLAEQCTHIIGFDPYDDSSLVNTKLNGMENFELKRYFLSDHEGTSEEIQATTLDSLVSKGSLKPDILKMDIEGEEYKALMGAKNLFREYPPQLVFIETHSEELFYQCLEFLQQFNYEVHHLGCPKVNVGGDIYPLAYHLDTDVYATKSVTRIILGFRKETKS